MAMVVRSNLMAYNANRQLGMNNSAVSKNLEKLSSGFKINRAADDASGLAISEKMKAQIKGLEQASLNSQDGISLVQTAEGALTEVHDMLNRMKELATKSANGTIQDQVDRENIQNEVDKLLNEIDRIGDSTNFNGINLLDGNLSGGAITKTAGTTVAADVAAVYEYDFSNAAKFALTDDTKTITIAGTTVNLAAAGGAGNINVGGASTLQSQLSDLEAALNADAGFSANWTASLNGDKLVVTANTAGKVGGNGPAAAPGNASTTATTGTVAADWAKTATEKVAGADAGDKTAGSLKINMKNNAKEGMSVTVAGQKYEFVAAGGTASDANATAITIGANAKASLDALYAQLSTDATVGAGGALDGKVTVATNAATGEITVTNAVAANLDEVPEAKIEGGGLVLQVGDTADAYNKVSVSVEDMRSAGLKIDGLSVSGQEVAGAAIQKITDAINQVSKNRGELGALQNRLEHTINNLDVTAENMTNANSRIRDTDMAKQMMEYTKMNVLTQSAQAMLAQANQNPQSILQLLQ